MNAREKRAEPDREDFCCSSWGSTPRTFTGWATGASARGVKYRGGSSLGLDVGKRGGGEKRRLSPGTKIAKTNR